MFTFSDNLLTIDLPQGHTMEELNAMAKQELAAMTDQFYGKDIKVNGRCTTALAMLLGHELSHVCKSVSIFDPKENAYVLVIKH